jgi:hypothetical protein
MLEKSSHHKKARKTRARSAWSRPDKRSPDQILREEALLTKPMLAKVFGYKSVRSVDFLVAEDCVSDNPMLKPVYLRCPENIPSLKSLRFRREDVADYIKKMQHDFPVDLEWKFGQFNRSAPDEA